jgi:hypothetical protein
VKRADNSCRSYGCYASEKAIELTTVTNQNLDIINVIFPDGTTSEITDASQVINIMMFFSPNRFHQVSFSHTMSCQRQVALALLVHPDLLVQMVPPAQRVLRDLLDQQVRPVPLVHLAVQGQPVPLALLVLPGLLVQQVPQGQPDRRG